MVRLLDSVTTSILLGSSSLCMVQPPEAAFSIPEDAIWIATDGDDDTGDGSEGNPLAELNTAINWAAPGQTIVVKDGTYTPTGLLNVYRGDLIIRAAPGASPVFDAAGYATPNDFNDRVIRLQDVSNVHIIGLGFTNGPDGGMQIIGTGSNIIIEKCWFFANGRASLFEGEGFLCEGNITNLLVIDCDSYENFDALGTPAGFNADGFRVSLYSGSAIFRKCRSWRNSDDGFDAFNNSFDEDVTTVSVVFDRCWAWENGYLAGGSASNGDGMGFKLGGQRPDLGNGSGGNTAIYCLSWGNRVNGFTDNESTIPNIVRNNTAFDNAINFESHATGTEMRNNISYDPGTSDTNLAETSNIDHNSWNGYTVTSADFQSVDDTAATGSRTSARYLPVTTFLALDAESAMFLAGDDGKKLGAR